MNFKPSAKPDDKGRIRPAPSVVLAGYQDQGNLGLGYLAASLITAGVDVKTVDLRAGPDALLAAIVDRQPALVGFSMIFQYYLPQFARWTSDLRRRGIGCHFTVGGHYPSLRWRQTLATLPAIDSVVLFEGEATLTALVHCLAAGGDWRRIDGIAWRHRGRAVCNRLRPLCDDLDRLAFPRHDTLGSTLGRKMAPILATRGCARRCAFCSIRQFYGQVPGSPVRRRSAANVVAEMKQLADHHGVSIFLFQDDDFPIGRRGWVTEFVDALKAAGLYGRVIWKISCRVDEVSAGRIATLKQAGLYLVYLGIESGNAAGLVTLNKQVSVAQNLKAAAVLRQQQVMFGFGFMLFDPDSTFDTVRANVTFLRRLTADGQAAVLYCKMLPYAGTPVEARLQVEGRLTGTASQPDYDFQDPLLTRFAEKLKLLLADWVHGPDALSHQLNLAWHELAVMRHLFPATDGMEDYTAFLRQVTRENNQTILDTIEASSYLFETNEQMTATSRQMTNRARQLRHEWLSARNQFVARNQDRLLKALAA